MSRTSKLSNKVQRLVKWRFSVLCELLGLIAVVAIKDLMLSPSEIVGSEKIEFEARKTFIGIIGEVQKTPSIEK